MEHERSCNAIFQRLLLTGIVSLSEPINFDKSPKASKESAMASIAVVKPILPGRICTNCGERIDPLRLSAQPYAYRCVPCQKDFEKLTGLSMNGNFS
jgi:DNA-directed RNA polymerase subunit RPC12/RpoP